MDSLLAIGEGRFCFYLLHLWRKVLRFVILKKDYFSALCLGTVLMMETIATKVMKTLNKRAMAAA